MREEVYPSFLGCTARPVIETSKHLDLELLLCLPAKLGMRKVLVMLVFVVMLSVFQVDICHQHITNSLFSFETVFQCLYYGFHTLH